MILKGFVSSIEEAGIRVTIKDRDNIVSPPIKAAVHVGALEVGQSVAVVFFSDNMLDGLIIAKY